MVKCPECGAALEEGDVRCHQCGHKMTDNTDKNSSGKNNSTNKLIAIIAVVVIIAIVGVLASGMFSADTSSNDSTAGNDDNVVSPIEDDDSNSDTAKSSSDSASGSTEYWASAKADKFHLPTCEWAEKISDGNKIVYQSREDAIKDGKEPCSVCNP